MCCSVGWWAGGVARVARYPRSQLSVWFVRSCCVLVRFQVAPGRHDASAVMYCTGGVVWLSGCLVVCPCFPIPRHLHLLLFISAFKLFCIVLLPRCPSVDATQLTITLCACVLCGMCSMCSMCSSSASECCKGGAGMAQSGECTKHARVCGFGTSLYLLVNSSSVQ